MSGFLRQQAPPDHEQNDVHHLKKSRNHEKAGGGEIRKRDTIPTDMTDNSNRVKWAFFESPKRSIQKTLIFPIDRT